MSVQEILQLAKDMDNEVKDIKRETLKISWYMRGMSFSEAIMLSHEERELVNEIIKDNLETTRKTQIPFV